LQGTVDPTKKEFRLPSVLVTDLRVPADFGKSVGWQELLSRTDVQPFNGFCTDCAVWGDSDDKLGELD
jgi:hypothetical protein